MTFGYKMAWFAIKNTQPEEIIQKLQLPDVQTKSWSEAMESVYSNGDAIIITPNINTWCFIVGTYLYDLDSGTTGLTKLKNRLAELSTIFEEVQAFATHRVSEYHHWIAAKSGKIKRCFAYSGERGEILCNEGELTDAEEHLSWDKLESFQWSPNEEDVMTIAGKWSMNPTTIEPKNLHTKTCYIANISSF